MAGLYIHIPFASSLSPYEDVYAEVRQGPFTTYVQALIQEMAHYSQKYNAPTIETSYIGGGVPSLLHIDEIYRLLEGVAEHFDAEDLRESTIEVSPEHAHEEYLSALRDAGFDRISLLVYSFYQEDLERLELPFTEEEARGAVEVAREAGFENITVDVGLGIPGQSELHWAAVLERLIALDVPHFALVEINGEPVGSEQTTDRYAFAVEYLQEKGFEQYEISHFARPGYRSEHNQRYWNHANVLGLGAGAYSFWWRGLPAYRWHNVRHTRRYEALVRQRQLPLEERQALSLDELAEEHIVLRMRTADGLDLNHLEDRYGLDLLTEKISELAALEENGLIEPIRNQRIRLTNKGKLLCDSVTARLLPESVV